MNMRIVLLCLLFVLVLLTTGCFKKDAGCPTSNTTAPSSEVAAVESYLSANGITTAVKHPSGFYFEIVAQGSGPAPGECSAVNVGYVGKFTNGSIFDQTSSVSLTLANVIEGWRKGLPLIQKG